MRSSGADTTKREGGGTDRRDTSLGRGFRREPGSELRIRYKPFSKKKQLTAMFWWAEGSGFEAYVRYHM